MRVVTRVLCGVVCALLSSHFQTSSVEAAIALGQFTDVNNGDGTLGSLNVFSNPPIGVNETGIFEGNDVAVYTFVGGGTNNGAGLSVGISNGENGITSTNGGANVDVNNAAPVHPVFAAIGNSSGKLENGNAIRLSMWMRQDPTNPVTKEPQIEPVLKMELWKEARSGNADFNNVAFPGAGDRIWDTDQNAGNAAFTGKNQTQADWVDVNNDGNINTGNPVALSLVPSEWRQAVTTLVVDDDPLDDGLGWSIGSEFFDVTAVEEIRAVMFVGDFANTDLTLGGSFFVDNIVVEVFKTEALMNAAAIPNSAPTAGLLGDYNLNGKVDAADYTVWRDGLGDEFVAGDYDVWKANFGAGSGSGSLSGSAVPEPATLLMLAGLLPLALGRRAKR